MPGSNTPTSNLPDSDDNLAPGVSVVNQQSQSVDVARLKQIACEILSDHDWSHTEISIAIVDDPTIHELNSRYLDHDYATDVLSFPFERDIDARRLSGEVIASADTASRVAAELGSTPQDELLLYVIHGLLHLIGYDDKREDDRQVMRTEERRYMNRAGASYLAPGEPDSPGGEASP
ncbi:MAG: rRNA maturation RNase YbeY [Mariniblastus sp.]|nr:rRNA maturation RNase YbeY [Mariniblastus sp.]